MKAKEITMQIVKNLGNYETARLEVVYELLENETDLNIAFMSARNELEAAFEAAYQKPKHIERKELTMTSAELRRVCQALANNQTDLKDLQKYFILNAEVFNYLQNQNLI